MDMYIDKWQSLIFDEDEIDFTTDAIENSLFKEFFGTEKTILAIDCASFDGELNRLMKAYNQTDKAYEYLTDEYARDAYLAIYEAAAPDAPVFALLANKGSENEDDLKITASVMTTSYGFIMAYAAAPTVIDDSEGILGLYGLNLVMARLLAMRGGEDSPEMGLYKSIFGTYFPHLGIPKSMFDAANKRVEKLFA